MKRNERGLASLRHRRDPPGEGTRAPFLIRMATRGKSPGILVSALPMMEALPFLPQSKDGDLLQGDTICLVDQVAHRARGGLEHPRHPLQFTNLYRGAVRQRVSIGSKGP